MVLMMGIACGLAGAPVGAGVFAEEKVIYYREASAGHNTLAYFIGKNLATIYRILLASFHYISLFYLLSTPSANFWSFYSFVALEFFCVYGLAHVVSTIVKREDAGLVATVVCLTVASLNGYGEIQNLLEYNYTTLSHFQFVIYF
jgi:hypothetical protein